MRRRRGKNLQWADYKNNRVRGHGTEGVAVLTHQIMADTPPSTGQYLKMHTLLLNVPTGCEYLNSLYTVPTTESVLAHIEDLNSNQTAGETIKSFGISQARRVKSETYMQPQGSPLNPCGSRASRIVTNSPGNCPS